MATVVDEEGGSPRHLQGLILDITSRKEAEERLAESEAMLRTIIESEPECVKLVGPDGALLAMNPAGLAMIEATSAQEVVGQSVYTLVDPAHREAFQALTEATFRGDSGTLGFDLTGLRGTRRAMEMHAVPLRDQAGEVVACLSITRDVSERNRAQAELETALARTKELAESLERLNASKSEMIQILSHELFTPITVIQGAALTLAQPDANIAAEDHRSLAASVRHASQRLHRLVGNISAAAQMGHDGIPISSVRVGIHEIVSRAIQEFPIESDRLHMPSDPEIPTLEVSLDPELAVRAIAIVLENALDCSPGVVEIDVARAPGSVVVSVADHGPGMLSEERELIFEAFTQVDPGTTRTHEGLGIGLYLARRIMQAHGGEIRSVTRRSSAPSSSSRSPPRYTIRPEGLTRPIGSPHDETSPGDPRGNAD